MVGRRFGSKTYAYRPIWICGRCGAARSGIDAQDVRGGREAVIGLGIILVWLGVTHVSDPTTVAEGVTAYGFFLFPAALGASIRFCESTRIREIEQAELRQRHELARDLHDTVGHHVSGIVIQAQAGQALAASHPDRALAVLATIEGAAARALEEMRAIVGVLRDGAEPDRAPQPDITSIERLARTAGSPRIDVHLSGTLDDLPPRRSASRSTDRPGSAYQRDAPRPQRHPREHRGRR